MVMEWRNYSLPLSILTYTNTHESQNFRRGTKRWFSQKSLALNRGTRGASGSHAAAFWTSVPVALTIDCAVQSIVVIRAMIID